jgi:D-serine deaminase-like pyridoxal phosphate-dependent protein
LAMDHGPPIIDGADVWFVSDEHTTFHRRDGADPEIGDVVRLLPGHLDPTMAKHERAWILDGDEVVDEWVIDLCGW